MTPETAALIEAAKEEIRAAIDASRSVVKTMADGYPSVFLGDTDDIFAAVLPVIDRLVAALAQQDTDAAMAWLKVSRVALDGTVPYSEVGKYVFHLAVGLRDDEIPPPVADALAVLGQDQAAKEDEARNVYARLLDIPDLDQAFLNGYRRCLMILDASFLPGEIPPGVASASPVPEEGEQ